VERARDLVAYLLASPAMPWTTPMVEEAIAAGNTRRVPVPRTLPVYLLYWTAFVDATGAAHFRDDVYGRDRRLAAALEADSGIIVPAGGPATRACSAAEEGAQR
jgi:murein L,D-transpeptidase YcbB/YkuD